VITTVIQQNLADVQNCMAAACAESGRDANDVNLVAVTKYAEWEWVQALATCHCVFGENRPQQLVERCALLPDAQWHLIGQLQRNKVRQVIPHATLIHSVDSLKLLNRIVDVSDELSLRPQILLQVNISGEASKAGFSSKDLALEWPSVLSFQDRVEVIGLMTMAPASDAPEVARPTFRGLADFRAELAAREDSQSLNVTLPELSMGMSNDFEVAIEEGATLVRIGSRLFQGL